MAPTEILIAGCGIAGPVLAMWLLRSSANVRLTIVERARSSESYGQNIDIRGAGATVMRKLGLDTAIRAHITGEEGARFVDENDKVIAGFPADKTGKIQTGTSDLEILRGRLADLCFRRCRDFSDQIREGGGVGVEFIFGEALTHLEQDSDKVHVQFAKSGKHRSFDLVVGADGLQSTTRKMAFGQNGDEERLHKTGMYGAFFSMPSSPRDSLWRRWYHAPSRRSIMVRPGETSDMSTVFMTVINDNDTRFAEVAALGRDGLDEQKSLLASLFKDAGWECHRIIDEMYAAKDFYYSTIAQVKMPRWSTGRVALLGDAGYCPSPISGMGTTLAITGAYNLAGALAQHPNDHAAAFEQYESTIRPNVERAQKLLPGFPHIFFPETKTGILIMRTIIGFIGFIWRLSKGFSMLPGPPANSVPVLDYGFEDLPEWEERS